MKTKLILLLAVTIGVAALSSCLPLVAAAGAGAGYVAHDQGYRLQNPVTKTGD